MGMPAIAPRYTVDDLDHFPNDGNRYELLDGMLLVTPGPGFPHQLVVSRLWHRLAQAVQVPGLAHVFGPGVVTTPPKTQLQPDILVLPSRFPATSDWRKIDENWLAVEVLSRSSYVYDREFKRDAYIALGVREVWLVDRRDHTIEVARPNVRVRTVRDVLRWKPVRGVELTIELSEVFAGL